MGTSDPGQPDATADISAEPDCQAAGSGPSAPPSPATDNTMRTQGEQVGAELSVMRAVALELAALDPDAARRVVEWAASRVAYDLAAVAASLDVVAAARVYQHAAGGQSYHWRSGRSSDLAVCGQSNLDTDNPFDAGSISALRRCRRSGCDGRWNNYDGHAHIAASTPAIPAPAGRRGWDLP